MYAHTRQMESETGTHKWISTSSYKG